jgi:hypothetical protein
MQSQPRVHCEEHAATVAEARADGRGVQPQDVFMPEDRHADRESSNGQPGLATAACAFFSRRLANALNAPAVKNMIKL